MDNLTVTKVVVKIKLPRRTQSLQSDEKHHSSWCFPQVSFVAREPKSSRLFEPDVKALQIYINCSVEVQKANMNHTLMLSQFSD